MHRINAAEHKPDGTEPRNDFREERLPLVQLRERQLALDGEHTAPTSTLPLWHLDSTLNVDLQKHRAMSPSDRRADHPTESP